MKKILFLLLVPAFTFVLTRAKIEKVDGKVVKNREELISNLGIFAVDLRQSPQLRGKAKKPSKFSFGYSLLKSTHLQGSALQYLSDFGYLEVSKRKSKRLMERTEALINEKDVEGAIRLIKRRYKKKVNGEIDEWLQSQVTKSRCGMKDMSFPEEDELKRSRRYTLSEGRWNKNDLFYWIDSQKMTEDLDAENVYDTIEKAFQLWANVADINFYETNKPEVADIKFSFEVKAHGDGWRFFGAGHTLAHAFYPSDREHRGKVHFDDDETFTLRRSTGINLLQVATHEIGHTLGIEHSNKSTALMWGDYPGYSDSVRLTKDDIAAVREIYGKGKGKVHRLQSTDYTTPPAVLPTVYPERPPLCWDRIDAMLRFIEQPGTNHVYVFSGHWYFKLKPFNTLKKNLMPVLDTSVPPKLIRDDFPGVPSHLDAAVTGLRDKTMVAFFFKDDKVYEFSFERMRLLSKPITLKTFFSTAKTAPGRIIGAWKINNFMLGYLSASQQKYVYNINRRKMTGPMKSHFNNRGGKVETVSQAFYHGWAWVIQGNFYGVCRSDKAVYASAREFRPIRKDMQIPMCRKGVADLSVGSKKNCKKEVWKLDKRPKGFRPSAECYDYIEEHLPQRFSKLSNLPQ